MQFRIKNREIIFVFKNILPHSHGNSIDSKIINLLANQLIDIFDLNANDGKVKNALERRLTTSFFNNYKQKLKALNKNDRNLDRFVKHYKNSWLEGEFNFIYDEKISLDAHVRVPKTGKVYILIINY